MIPSAERVLPKYRVGEHVYVAHRYHYVQGSKQCPNCHREGNVTCQICNGTYLLPNTAPGIAVLGPKEIKIIVQTETPMKVDITYGVATMPPHPMVQMEAKLQKFIKSKMAKGLMGIFDINTIELEEEESDEEEASFEEVALNDVSIKLHGLVFYDEEQLHKDQGSAEIFARVALAKLYKQ